MAGPVRRPVRVDADVVVLGTGPAGTAAVAAAVEMPGPVEEGS